MVNIRFTTLLLINLFAPSLVQGNLSGAPLCLPGNAALAGHPQDGGPLSSQFLDVAIDGTVLNPTESYAIAKDSTYTLTVGQRVAGIMIRLSAGGADVTTAISLVDGEVDLKLGPCLGPADISITHVSKDLKGIVTVTLNTAGLSGELTLDVTSVYSLTGAVYNGFKLVVQDSVPTEPPIAATVAPTVAPTVGVVVTDAPTAGVVVTDAPTAGVVVTDAPTAGVIVTDAPTAGVIVTDAPTAGVIVTDAPTAGVIVTDAPTAGVIVTDAPTAGVIVTDAPTAGAVATDPPSIPLAITDAPTDPLTTASPTATLTEGPTIPLAITPAPTEPLGTPAPTEPLGTQPPTVFIQLPDVGDIIADSPELSSLNVLVESANITIKAPFTFLAPSNNAFDLVDPAFLNKLLRPRWILHLDNLLKMHVSYEQLFAETFVDDQTLLMQNEELVTVNIYTDSNGIPTIVFSPATSTVEPELLDTKVEVSDVIADGGVLHQIGGLIAPKFLETSLFALIGQYTRLSTFYSLIQLVPGLEDILSTGDYTVLAPSNPAFTALGDDTIDFLINPENVKELNKTLTYHILTDVIPSSQLVDRRYETLNGRKVTVDTCNGLVFDGVKVGELYDLLAYNGIVHTIGGVLTPDAPAPTPLTEMPVPPSKRKPTRKPRRPTSNIRH